MERQFADAELVLHFLKSGMYTLIQDMGRPGYQTSGIPAGGSLDKPSAAAANWCVGNPETSPVLEMTIIGPQIYFNRDCQIAITGADISPIVNGEYVPMYQTNNIKAGSTLTYGKLRSGCRAYLAVRGEWQVARWLDSASALRVGDTDLVTGALIQKENKIRVKSIEALTELRTHPHPVFTWPAYKTIRVLPGPEFNAFTAQQTASLFSTRFTITQESNRIGYRLDPAFSDYQPGPEIISSGIIPGTIQITHRGQLVILLADAQTTGGYPRIANVLTEDLDLLAQLKPGDVVGFQIISVR